MHSLPLPRLASRAAACAALLGAGAAFALAPQDLQKRLDSGDALLLVDIRPAIDFQAAHIPGSIHVPETLIGRRELGRSVDIVLVADGLGLADARSAEGRLRTAGYSRVEVLEGGIAAWRAFGGLDSRPPGLSRESLPALSYEQVLKGSEPFTLLDVRTATARRTSRLGVADPVATLAGKLGGAPVAEVTVDSVAKSPSGASGAMKDDPSALARQALVAAEGQKGDRVLLIVADDVAAAEETARLLRSSGGRRFALLIGGTEAILREGKPGLDRLGSTMNSTPMQP